MYTDIHSHILPGLDDGAKDLETALQMLKQAVSDGTHSIVATPHFIMGYDQGEFRLVDEKRKELQKLADHAGINLTIYPGCEVFICPEVLELYEKKVICTIGGSRYILIEFPMLSIPDYSDKVLYELQLRGLIPIIAHPERNMEFIKQPERLETLIKRGMLAQVNSGSITGIFGRDTKEAAIDFIRMGLVQFVASDAHTTGRRSPKLNQAAYQIEKLFGRDTVDNLFNKNGMMVLNNTLIEAQINENNIKKRSLKKIVSKAKHLLFRN